MHGGVSGWVSVGTGHATGVSAMAGGILEAFTWLVIAMAFAAALLWLRSSGQRLASSR